MVGVMVEDRTPTVGGRADNSDGFILLQASLRTLRVAGRHPRGFVGSVLRTHLSQLSPTGVLMLRAPALSTTPPTLLYRLFRIFVQRPNILRVRDRSRDGIIDRNLPLCGSAGSARWSFAVGFAAHLGRPPGWTGRPFKRSWAQPG